MVVVLLVAAVSGGMEKGNALPRRRISPDHPLFLFQAGDSKAFAALPPRVRACAAMFLGAIGVQGATARLEQWLANAAAAGVPVAISIRTHFPVRDESDYGKRMMTPDDLEGILSRHSNVVAVLDNEQYGFNAEQRRYLVRTLDIAASHGVYFIFNAGWHAGCNWDDLIFDEEVRSAVARQAEFFLPMWEMNISKGMYTQQAQLLGLWLSGWCRHWGANPQRWYWGEAGFGALGESFGCRFRRHGGMKRAGEYLRYFPMYGPMIGLTSLTGAEVLFIGGERYPTLFTAAGKLSSYATETILPFLEALLTWRMIPSREMVGAAVRLQVSNPTGTPFRRDNTVARTGLWSLRLDCGSGASRRLAWGTDGFVRVVSRGEHRVRVWAKCRGVKAVCLQVSWFDGVRWKEVRSRSLSGDHEWTLLEIRDTPPEQAGHALIFLKADSPEGTVWFDDASFRDLGSGKEWLANGSFERGRAGGRRAVGWQPQCVNGPPETHLCRRGPNALWQAVYGVRHDAELIPDSGAFFPVVWRPVQPEAVLREIPSGVPHLLIDPEWTPDAVSSLLPPPAAGRRGFSFVIGDRFFLANPHENEDIVAEAACSVKDLSFQAVLPVHAWVAGVVRGDGLHLLCGGREKSETLVRVHPGCRLPAKRNPHVEVVTKGEESWLTFHHPEGGTQGIVLEIPGRGERP